MTKLLTVLFVWVAVYSGVTLSLLGFRWFNISLPLPVQTLILTAVLVPVIMFVIAPNASRLAGKIVSKY